MGAACIQCRLIKQSLLLLLNACQRRFSFHIVSQVQILPVVTYIMAEVYALCTSSNLEPKRNKRHLHEED